MLSNSNLLLEELSMSTERGLLEACAWFLADFTPCAFLFADFALDRSKLILFW